MDSMAVLIEQEARRGANVLQIGPSSGRTTSLRLVAIRLLHQPESSKTTGESILSAAWSFCQN
jgi:hypothetical protein